jgi:hypothetical protein
LFPQCTVNCFVLFLAQLVMPSEKSKERKALTFIVCTSVSSIQRIVQLNGVDVIEEFLQTAHLAIVKRKCENYLKKKKIKMQISLFLKWITYLNVYIFLPIKFNYSPFEIILSFLRQLCLVCRKQWRHFFFYKKV